MSPPRPNQRSASSPLISLKCFIPSAASCGVIGGKRRCCVGPDRSPRDSRCGSGEFVMGCVIIVLFDGQCRSASAIWPRLSPSRLRLVVRLRRCGGELEVGGAGRGRWQSHAGGRRAGARSGKDSGPRAFAADRQIASRDGCRSERKIWERHKWRWHWSPFVGRCSFDCTEKFDEIADFALGQRWRRAG